LRHCLALHPQRTTCSRVHSSELFPHAQRGRCIRGESLRTGGHRPYPGDANWTRSCCVAYGRAAVVACDLFAELGRSSQKLIAVAPRLRARGAGAVIETLLDEDAVPAAARGGAISARGSRRLFDRLVALGGVRELTGRSTFRLYGL
jgi:hypothetical protein